MNLPPYPNKIGNKGTGVDIDGIKHHFVILDEIVRPQSTNPQKLIYFQKIQFDIDKKIEFRIAYYIIGKKPRMAGKWVFGQYATMMNPDDFEFLVSEAKAKGWITSGLS